MHIQQQTYPCEHHIKPTLLTVHACLYSEWGVCTKGYSITKNHRTIELFWLEKTYKIIECNSLMKRMNMVHSYCFSQKCNL